MKPIPIPDSELPKNTKRHTFGAPEGLEDAVVPVEAAVGMMGDNFPFSGLLIELEEGDLKSLQEHGRFWLILLTHLIPPFQLAPYRVQLINGTDNGGTPID